MLFLKQSTASQSVLIGPFIDKTDGSTAETGLTIANTDIRLSANGGNMFAKTSGGGTHDEAGWYAITLDATDTATVGRLQVSTHVTADALPTWNEFTVVEEAIYVALFAASAAAFDSNQRVDVGLWLGTAATSGTGGPDVNVNAIGDSTAAATQLALSADTIVNGTASGAPTTTTMVSDISITADDQLKGRVIIFADDTTTTNLRDQATDITGCTASTNTLTFTALTDAPVSGDTFVIV